MNHYLDIRLLPDPEFTATVLMSALFSKLHRGLAELGTGRVGVQFSGCGAIGLRPGGAAATPRRGRGVVATDGAAVAGRDA